MITIFQAAIFGIIQGITELFPISSLGHSVLLPTIFGWHIDQNNPVFLTFLVATHTATALVLFFYFWKDWKRIIWGIFRSLKKRKMASDPDAKLGWLLVAATVPAGILGLLFQDPLEALFASPALVAGVLILNGVMLSIAELAKRRIKEEPEEGSDNRLARLSWLQAIKIGVAQCLALIPGFSRTGAAMTGGLFTGLSHEDAARFSFLLATPIIGAASVLKLPELFLTNEHKALGPVVIGAVCAGIAAYLSIRFLTKYFETKKLTPFAIYCIVVGFLVSVLFFVGK